MSGFLHRVLTRHDATLAPLRRRRPSLFEAREPAPAPMPEALPLPVATPLGPTQVVHTREIHHHAASPSLAPAPTLRSHVAAERGLPEPAVPSPAAPLPMPPALRAPARQPLTAVARVTARDTAPPPSAATDTPQRKRDASPEAIGPARREAPRGEAAPTARPAPRPSPGPLAPPLPAAALPLPPRLPQAQRSAAPVAHPARRAALPALVDTPVQVSIGSVEIRAHAPASPSPAHRPRTAAAPLPSLDAYLRERHGGPR